MTSHFKLTNLPLEVFATVLEKLFEDVTVRVERPPMLSRIEYAYPTPRSFQACTGDSSADIQLTNFFVSLIARKLPDLGIFQVLNGDHHRLAKASLLKAASFEFELLDAAIAHTYSAFHKYLDRIQKLVVRYDKLAFSTYGDLQAPYKYIGAPKKYITPYESAIIYANRKSLRLLRVKRYLALVHGLVGSPPRPLSLRERVGIELAKNDNIFIGERGNTRDILRLGRTKISGRCQVVLELTFSNYPNDNALVSLHSQSSTLGQDLNVAIAL